MRGDRRGKQQEDDARHGARRDFQRLRFEPQCDENETGAQRARLRGGVHAHIQVRQAEGRSTGG